MQKLFLSLLLATYLIHPLQAAVPGPLIVRKYSSGGFDTPYENECQIWTDKIIKLTRVGKEEAEVTTRSETPIKLGGPIFQVIKTAAKDTYGLLPESTKATDGPFLTVFANFVNDKEQVEPKVLLSTGLGADKGRTGDAANQLILLSDFLCR